MGVSGAPGAAPARGSGSPRRWSVQRTSFPRSPSRWVSPSCRRQHSPLCPPTLKLQDSPPRRPRASRGPRALVWAEGTGECTASPRAPTQPRLPPSAAESWAGRVWVGERRAAAAASATPFSRKSQLSVCLSSAAATQSQWESEWMAFPHQLRTRPQVQPTYLQPLGALLELAVPELAYLGALGTWEFILFLERTLALTWEGFSGRSQAHLAFGMCGSGVSSAVHTSPTPPPPQPAPLPINCAYLDLFLSPL